MVNVAILGFGVVGSGVAEVIDKNSKSIAAKAANEIRVKYILDLLDYPESPFADRIIHDFAIIENDPEVQIVVECIGGAKVALDYTKRALIAGKNVVTSNKELVARHGYELLQLAKEKNLNYLFEASVGGGIPILRPLNQCLAANELTEIYGILNGTTNYILSKMIHDGVTFEAALKEAQEKGYAEANPSADIEGVDACRKICILSALSFGRHVYPDQVPTEGIRDITLDDVACAQAAGKKIKLLGRSLRDAQGKILAYVAPHMVDNENQLANVENVFNGIIVKGDAIGDVMFYGQGAGKLPTASAVVADVIDAAKHFTARKYVDWEDGGDDVIGDVNALPIRWLIRANETPDRARNAFGGIELVLRPGAPEGEVAFITDELSKYQLDEKLVDFEILSVIRVLD